MGCLTNKIREVSIMIRDLIQSELSISEENILFDSPGGVENPSGGIQIVSLFLYKVAENVDLRNHEPNYFRKETEDIRVDKYPPFFVDLHYMFTPYAGNREIEFTMMEKLLWLFRYHAYLQFPENGPRLSLVPTQLQLSELNNLWSVFRDKTYKPSLIYMVTPLKIPYGEDVSAVQIDGVETSITKKE